MALLQGLTGPARRAPEHRVEAAIGHREAGAEGKIIEVQSKRTIRLHIDQVIEDCLYIFRCAIGGEAHGFIFAGIDLKPRVVGECRIEQPERMWKMNFLDDPQVVVLAECGRGRRPLADAVHRQDERRLKWCGIISRSGMRKMMFAKAQLSFVAERWSDSREFAEQKVALKQLFANPQRHGFAKRSKTARRECEISFDQPFESQERLFVKDDAIDATSAGLGLF